MEARNAARRLKTNIIYDLDDLIQEAWLIALTVISKHDATRGEVNTFIGACVRHHLGKLTKKANKDSSWEYRHQEIVEKEEIRLDMPYNTTENMILRVFSETESILVVAQQLGMSRNKALALAKELCEKLKS